MTPQEKELFEKLKSILKSKGESLDKLTKVKND